MDHYVDWNCRLCPNMRNQISDPRVSLAAMMEMAERFSITHFCMMPDYDCTKESISLFLLRRARSEAMLRALLPSQSNIKIKMGARAVLSETLYQTKSLDKLLFIEDYLPIVMPMTEYDDWIDLALNHLLYKAKMKKLLFTSFDLCVLLYPKETIEKLLRIPNAIIQINFNSLTDTKIQKLISRLMRENRIVLMGTSLNELDRIYRYEFDYYTKSATEHIPVADYMTMLRRSNRFWLKQH